MSASGGLPASRPWGSIFLVAVLAVAGASQSTAQPVTHGPILGRLSSSDVAVWARTGAPGTFRVRYGLAPDSLEWVSDPARTEAFRDNTGWVRLAGLAPGTQYFYRLEADGPIPPVASFQTLPSASDFSNPEHNPRGLFNFSFEFACGNKQDGTGQPAFRTMLERLDGRIDFAIQNGDWLYEEARDFPVSEWAKAAGTETLPRRLSIAPTLAGVWQNYKLYLQRGMDLAAWHREVPSFFVFDDHEILGDVNGAGTIGLRSRRAVFRDIGVQGWYDYLGWANFVPWRQGIRLGRARLAQGEPILYDAAGSFEALNLDEAATLTVHWGEPDAGVNEKELDTQGGDPNAGVYGIEEILDGRRLRIRPAPVEDSLSSYSIGRLNYWNRTVGNAELFFLDTRSHRQVHDKADPFRPGLSMLGGRQKNWLTRLMASSSADFLFVVSSVNLMIPHVGPGMGGPNKDEAWTALAAEREELIEFWDGLGKPVFVLTGDLHNSFAIQITDRVWEFASGPHSSRNHPLASEAGRPPNGVFQSRGRTAQIRWSTFFLDDSGSRKRPVYCVVKVNNVFDNPDRDGRSRWVAYPRPQAVFQYYDGLSGELLYAESILAEPVQE